MKQGTCGILLLLLVAFLSKTSGQTPVYLSLGSINITTNNAEIVVTDIEEDNDRPSLTCHTDLVTCCRNSDTGGQGGLGEWYYPDGRVVPNQATGENFYRVRNAPQVVRLARHRGLGPTGTYCCVIPTNQGLITFCANLVLPTNCRHLSDPENGHVTSSGTNIGSVATYSCRIGYQITGRSTQTCEVTGQWTPGATTCDLVNCGQLANPVNGQVDTTTGTTFNNLAMYSCNVGYTLEGVSQRVCGDDGNWTPNEPFCTIIDCSRLPVPNNGRVQTPSGTIYNSAATYTCDHGYILDGVNSRTCQANRMWSGTTPVCNPVDCGALANPANGQVETPSGTTLGKTATYRCDSGYNIAGSRTRTCNQNRQWTPAAPNCYPVDCGSLPNPVNGQVDTSTGTTFTNVATYSCNTGHNLRGSRTRNCSANRQWTSNAPTCIVVDCGRLLNPEKGFIDTSSGTTYNKIASYTCPIEGYKLVGTSQRTCLANGVWSSSAPSCVPIDCGALEDPDNGNVDTSHGTYFNSTATYSCDPGHNLTGSVVRVCQSNGMWSSTAPYCADNAMIQLKFGPTSHCIEWNERKAAMMERVMRDSIAQVLFDKIDHVISLQRISRGLFSCRTSKSEATYRTTITGTDNVSAVDLVAVLKTWVDSGATVRVQWYLVDIDKNCSVSISSLREDECT